MMVNSKHKNTLNWKAAEKWSVLCFQTFQSAFSSFSKEAPHAHSPLDRVSHWHCWAPQPLGVCTGYLQDTVTPILLAYPRSNGQPWLDPLACCFKMRTLRCIRARSLRSSFWGLPRMLFLPQLMGLNMHRSHTEYNTHFPNQSTESWALGSECHRCS